MPRFFPLRRAARSGATGPHLSGAEASASGMAASEAAGASPRSDRLLLLLGVLLPVCISTLGLMQLWDLRRDAWSRVEMSAQNLLLVVSRDIQRQVDIYDRVLAQVAGHASRHQTDGLPSAELLFSSAAAITHLGSMTLLDASGQVMASSDPAQPLNQDMARRDFFLRHLLEPDLGLYISQPMPDRAHPGEFLLALSRRVTTPEGRFGGVVVGTLRLSFLRSLLAELHIGPGSTINLFSSTGVLLYREPMGSGIPGIDLSQAPTVRRMMSSPTGQFTGTAALDGVERLYTYTHLGDRPLILNVAMATRLVEGNWQGRALGIGGMVLLLCLAMLGLAARLRRELRLRRLAEAEALAEGARFRALSETDGLTGLANRRHLDRLLSLEWERAERMRQPLALVMLDLDHFKAFNDSQGHPAGDAVLRSLAGCIRTAMRQDNDLAARYGGEEFAVLMPDTDLDGATRTAERIRIALRRLDLPHPGVPGGRVSVSLGVAAMHPQPGSSPATLVQAADAALYHAKKTGRDQVSAAA
ncbi:sensor domain-containing diguanylate cyclase [Roseomonas sp. GC11]|uniref:GGDEF domain-containing protein n=1 Tax=Roseomonas sp. GC11 TaxID=2950546 RepID=UPI00210E3462|nr:sensor domain-containing diguanylate cyclase [Roseomonas sp. GC11]MCQ4160568.1 sensor domain-containing diguanylate cyclase [Roseomonas sp. GC11]